MDIPDTYSPIPNFFPFPTFIWLVVAGILFAVIMYQLVQKKNPQVWLVITTGAAVILSALYHTLIALGVFVGIGVLTYFVEGVLRRRQKKAGQKQA